MILISDKDAMLLASFLDTAARAIRPSDNDRTLRADLDRLNADRAAGLAHDLRHGRTAGSGLPEPSDGEFTPDTTGHAPWQVTEHTFRNAMQSRTSAYWLDALTPPLAEKFTVETVTIQRKIDR